MKQKRLVSMVGALVLTISAVVLITGCPQPNNKKDNSSNTTQMRSIYVAREGSTTFTIMFETDGTFASYVAEGSAGAYAQATGIYTGDASKDGTITIILKKEMNAEGTALVDYTGTDATHSVTISGGKFTIAGRQYSRQ